MLGPFDGPPDAWTKTDVLFGLDAPIKCRFVRIIAEAWHVHVVGDVLLKHGVVVLFICCALFWLTYRLFIHAVDAYRTVYAQTTDTVGLMPTQLTKL